jgi:hypothetical protein
MGEGKRLRHDEKGNEMPKDENGQESFLYWLGQVASEARRRRANITPEFLSPLIGVNNTTLRRFEQGQTWPRNIDMILQAYAELGGYRDARELMLEAATRYAKKGRAPTGPRNFSKLIALLEESTPVAQAGRDNSRSSRRIASKKKEAA